jgi:hypothetical protein
MREIAQLNMRYQELSTELSRLAFIVNSLPSNSIKEEKKVPKIEQVLVDDDVINLCEDENEEVVVVFILW